MQKELTQLTGNGTQTRQSPQEQMATELAAIIESLLFVSGRPLERAELRKLLDVAALLGLPMTAKLTSAALETLAVISYRQPVTRAQIEAVRGVNSDRALASLIQHGLVTEVGRAQTVGRPTLFSTTSDFLQLFGLTSLEQLPHISGAPAEPSGEAGKANDE